MLEAAAGASSVHERGDAQTNEGDDADEAAQNEAAQQPGFRFSHVTLRGGNFALL